MTMKILVTGATGFIGSRIVELALESGHDVRALVRTLPGKSPAKDSIEYFAGDLLDPSSLAATSEGVDAVIHAAARVRWGSSAEFHRDCVIATARVVPTLTGSR